MSLGPTRRPKNARLVPAAEASLQSASASNGKEECYPSTSTGARCRDSFRNRGPYRTPVDGNVVKSSRRRRVPFLVWTVAVSMYCCIIYLHSSLYRDTSRHFSIDTERNERSNLISQAIQSSNERSPNSHQRRALLTSVNHDGKSSTASNDGHRLDQVVHVIQTRFQQQQSHLLELGLARLALFEAFCLPSMLSQTSKDFMWIIRTDPDLHPFIRSRLQSLLEERQNFVLIGSNSNPEGFGRDGGTWQNFLGAKQGNQSRSVPIWSGNASLLEKAYRQSSEGAILLETRLDSDDGLERNFVEAIQAEARIYLQNTGAANQTSHDLWRLWCTDSRIEWHPLNPYPSSSREISGTNETLSEGYLLLFNWDKACSSAGLTFGYGNGASRASMGIKHLRHDEISRMIKKCSGDGVKRKCVSFIKDLLPGAVRARTATSAGMNNVITGIEELDKRNGIKTKKGNTKLIQQYEHQDLLWRSIQSHFGISKRGAMLARSIVTERSKEIADEGMRGQCTKGHSCKKGAMAALEMMAG